MHRGARAIREMVATVIKQEEKAAIDAMVATAEGGATSALAFTVTDRASQAVAAQALRWCKDASKALETERKRATDPVNQALAVIRSWFKPAEQRIAAAEQHLRGELSRYEIALRAENERAMSTGAPMIAPAQAPEVKMVPKVEILITDPGMVPRELCSPDEGKIRAAINAGATNIPGVQIVRTVATRLTGGRR